MKNKTQNIVIKSVMLVCFTLVSLLFVAVVAQIILYGAANLDAEVFSPDGGLFSVLPSMINTFWLVVGALIISVPLSVFAAMFLWFYQRRYPRLISVLQALIDSLGAVPSIVYALFGLLLFVGTLGMGFSLLSGILTVTILILPVLIRAAEQSLQAIGSDVYLSGLSLGLSEIYVMFAALLPQAWRGILSGIVLAVGRIVGESAALIFTMGTASGMVTSLFSSGTTLAVQVYSLAGEGLYLKYAYATSLVLLIFVTVLRLLSHLLLNRRQV